MYDIRFNDYIATYKNINSTDWITIYEQNEQKNYENDIFTFCALIDKEKVFENEYMKKFDWGFATDSFGKAGFGTSGWGEDEKVFFFDGTVHDNFEYLVALRFFEKYETSVEINPKLIWYGNLVAHTKGFVDPITDELVIEISRNQIKVKKEYLKDFLCAFGKVCVVVFDHRRFFNSDTRITDTFEDFSDKNYYISLSISSATSFSSKYNGCATIIGKAIILPYKLPRHSDYKYFTKENQYEKFIIDYDEEEDEMIEFTCNEKELANYFGSNPESPHFLTPVFFDITVLDKYKNDPRNYAISDSNISFLSNWSIPFNINKQMKVSVWLGDLGRIPYEEQKYWKSFNIRPTGEMDSKFIDRQLKGIWTDASRIESKLVSSLNRFNALVQAKFNGVIFNLLSDADKEIYNTFMIPSNHSIPEYQSFLLKLSKLTAESINVKLIKTVLGEIFETECKGSGSISQLGVFLKHTKIDENEKIVNPLKKAYNSRNKLAGHSASFGEYNKVWGREKEYKFNSIEDARQLIEEIVSAIEYVIVDYEARIHES